MSPALARARVGIAGTAIKRITAQGAGTQRIVPVSVTPMKRKAKARKAGIEGVAPVA